MSSFDEPEAILLNARDMKEIKEVDDGLASYIVGFEEALDMAIEALHKMSYLTGRPCVNCNAHSANGCGLWRCVFDRREHGE